LTMMKAAQMRLIIGLHTSLDQVDPPFTRETFDEACEAAIGTSLDF
jgi:hypothetical protein